MSILIVIKTLIDIFQVECGQNVGLPIWDPFGNDLK